MLAPDGCTSASNMKLFQRERCAHKETVETVPHRRRKNATLATRNDCP